MKSILRIGAVATLVAGLTASLVGHIGQPRYVAQVRMYLADGTDDTPVRLLRSQDLIRTAAVRVEGERPEAVPTTSADAPDAMASTIRNGVSVHRVDGTRLVDVAIAAPDPQLAAASANAIADAYVAREDDAAQRASTAVLDQITRARAQQDATVAGLEQQAAAARAAQTAHAGEQPLIASLNASLARARAQRLSREPLYRQVEAAGDPLAVPVIAQHPAVQLLTRRIAALEQVRTGVLQRYGEKHAASIDATHAVDAARALREEAARRVAQMIRQDYQDAAAREQVLTQQLASASASATAVTVDPTLDARLARERDVASSLAAQEQALRASLAATTSGARVLDRAVPPDAPDSLALELMWPLLFASALLGAVTVLFDRRQLILPALVHAASARRPLRVSTGHHRPAPAPAATRSEPEVLDRDAVARLLGPQPVTRKTA